MEERDRSRSPSRRTSRVEQVVGRWLRRSRDSSSRERILVDGKAAVGGESSGQDQKNSYPVRLTVQILRDPLLNTHGITLTPQTPILVQDITPAGPADGRLIPGDQVVKINNVAVDDLTPEQAADLIRECQHSVMITVLRNSAGPKSSFITPEKRAKLRSNPVKVRFAEEVEVNSHSQGNSLLFLPNVLKVYLENGQTKAFKFEPNTTVKDIVMTLKEKLSLSRIEHFSLVLEQKYSISKLLLLHEEERIQQVVHQKEVHDYRCLFRVCFIPREPEHLLQDDPTAFQYLYLQGINDVLQERFAVEMRCNTALRLAALHIQERLASCGQSPRTKLKIITKSWGIENFISSTLLRNMREKDLRKAIGYHMKKSQSQEPKQKVLSANQAKINYLEELCDLKSFGGKSFSATMMLQDRESMVTLLVGSRYGISQVVNHKLSIMTTLTEFSSITRIELLPESDRVSLVKIYLQDIKPITLLLESVAAKELSCLVAGYCRALVDPSLIIFPWTQDGKQHRVSAEEGYVSRGGSDSDDSSDMDMDTLISLVSHNNKRTTSDPVGLRRIMEERKEERKERKEREDRKKNEKGEGEQEKNMKYGTMSPLRKNKKKERIEEKVGGVGDQREKDTEAGGEVNSGKQRGAENGAMQEDDREREDKSAKKEREGKERKGEEERGGERKGGGERKEEEERGGGERKGEEERGGGEVRGAMTEEHRSVSEEASDSCRTDSRFMTSISSDSLDALEEDDLIACSSSLPHPHPPFRLTVEPPHPQPHPREGASSPQGRAGEWRGEGGGGGSGEWRGGGGECRGGGGEWRGGGGEYRGGGRGRRSGNGAWVNSHHSPMTPDSINSEPVTPVVDPSENLNYAELSLMLEYLPSPPEASDDEDEEEKREERRRSNEGTGQEVLSVSGCPRSSSSSLMDCVFTFEQSDARHYYNICPNVTPDSTRSLTHPHPETEEEEGGGEEEEQGALLTLEPVPILQPPPGFGDSSSDEEFFDARDRIASPEDPTSGTVSRDFSAEMTSGMTQQSVSLSDIRISLAEGTRHEREAGREGETSEGGGGRDMFSRLSRKRSKKRRSFMQTDFTSTVSYPGPDQNQERNRNPDHVPDQHLDLAQNRTESSDESQQLSLDPEPSEQSQNPCPTVSSLSHAEGEASQLESKPILAKPSPEGSHRGPGEPRVLDNPKGNPRAPDNPKGDLHRSSRNRRQSMETEPDMMESKSVTALVTAASLSITAVRCRVEPDGKESPDRRGDGEEVEGEMEEEEGGGEAGAGPFTCHMFLTEIKEEEGQRGEETGEEGEEGESDREERQPSLISEGPPSVRGSQFSRRPLCLTKDEDQEASFVPQISISHPGVYGRDTGGEQGMAGGEESVTPLSAPPPPTSPLPPFPAPSIPHTERGERDSKDGNVGSQPKLFILSDGEKDISCLTQVHRKLAISHQDLTSQRKAEIKNDEDIDSTNSVTDNTDVATANIADTGHIHSVMANTETTVDSDLATANHKDTNSIKSVPANTIAYADFATTNNEDNAIINSLTTSNDSTGNANLAMTNANSANANSATANIPKESPISPTTGFLLRPCSPGIIGQSLSASTLRGKIQSLPLYLSRSQETLTLSGVGSPNRSPSPETTSNKTEVMVTTETTKYDDVTKVATGEDLKDSGVALVESDDSEVTLTESEVGEVVVETAGAEITRLTVSEVKEVIEKVVMVYGSSLPPPLAPISLESKPDPKMVVKLPTCPIATVETAPPMAPAPICLEPKPVPELLSPGSTIHKMAAPLPSCPSFRVPIRVEPKPDHEPLSIRSKMAALSSSYPPALVVTTESLNSSSSNPHPIRVEPMPEPCLEPFSGPKMSAPLSSCPSALVVTTQSLVVTTQSLVVTTQSLNGPGLSFPSSNMRGQPFGSNSFCRPPGEEAGLLNTLTTGCGVFTSTCETQPNQAHMESYSPAKPDFGCSSVLASGCETVMEGVQTPLEACRCPPPLVYTNCFSGGDSFDDELTVYEFSCRTSSPPASQPSSSALALPLTTSPPLSSFLSSSPPSSLLSPSFPRSVLPPSSSMELSPLLSPLLSPSNCFLSQSSLHDDISRLRHRRFPPPPAGFQNVRSDVDELLTLLQGGRMGSRGGRHPRETCATHFSENKRLLHGEARRLMAGCQKVVRVGQTPDEMLFSLSDSFRTLVGMAGMCLWFSGCDRCDRRNAEALAGLADVARTYREFVLAAERASGRRSCHDLSTKLLAKQCTALTASVFCLTQLFRTLTAL
ncbi:FERM and PDZ domain-containing protein 1-like [Oncorhynchus kisutch]|uniref:FERM and PDZ domain-containing protein 1-like n=1 Tax=Oncorhynchus kisutch TaxID=8019 RepID=UPI0012DD072D|nr:FERM and PDZ domain-containing protein 1-like [Oncorhynchus kisutch]